jgi:hypothetical protein
VKTVKGAYFQFFLEMQICIPKEPWTNKLPVHYFHHSSQGQRVRSKILVLFLAFPVACWVALNKWLTISDLQCTPHPCL